MTCIDIDWCCLGGCLVCFVGSASKTDRRSGLRELRYPVSTIRPRSEAPPVDVAGSEQRFAGAPGVLLELFACIFLFLAGNKRESARLCSVKSCSAWAATEGTRPSCSAERADNQPPDATGTKHAPETTITPRNNTEREREREREATSRAPHNTTRGRHTARPRHWYPPPCAAWVPQFRSPAVRPEVAESEPINNTGNHDDPAFPYELP